MHAHNLIQIYMCVFMYLYHGALHGGSKHGTGSYTCISCIMGTRDLPDIYAQSPRAEGVHIRQIPSAHVTTDM